MLLKYHHIHALIGAGITIVSAPLISFIFKDKFVFIFLPSLLFGVVIELLQRFHFIKHEDQNNKQTIKDLLTYWLGGGIVGSLIWLTLVLNT